MEIYIVQPGDSINTIAERYGVSVEKLINDNGLERLFNLTVGQTIVIAYPEQSHTVQEGDTLQSIAASYNVTPMQILRNNSYLSDREFLYPGESLVISYDTIKNIRINGFAYPFIKRETLIKTLPNLTYLSIFNYSITEKGAILEYYDDTDIIKASKDYGVIPLMLLTTLTQQGESNVELAYSILLSEEYQERHINEFIHIMKNKGYYGLNIVFNYLQEYNQMLYLNFVKKISDRLQQEKLLFFITINYSIQLMNNEISLEQIDYSAFSDFVNGIIFLKFIWGTDYGPPAPVININNIRTLINYVSKNISSNKIMIGKPTISYDWQLPYQPNRTSAVSLSLSSSLNLAYETGSVIQFDEDSLTPYFYYNQYSTGFPYEHIVWSIDARSIKALNEVIIENDLSGSGVWNIMIYYPQLWTIINATFDTVKLI